MMRRIPRDTDESWVRWKNCSQPAQSTIVVCSVRRADPGRLAFCRFDHHRKVGRATLDVALYRNRTSFLSMLLVWFYHRVSNTFS